MALTPKSGYGMVQKWTYCLSNTGIWFINAALTTWVFTFYFSAKQLDVRYISLAYIIWTVWNAFNDPLIGYLSDKTHTRWGRRIPYIIIGGIPLVIVEIIMWLPPFDSEYRLFAYLLLMLILYDASYTSYSMPYDALFPELYTSVEERAQVNTIKQFLSIIGLLGAFLVPGYFIVDLTDPSGYLTNGIITSVTLTIITIITLIWGVRERKEFRFDYRQNFSFFTGLKYTFKNKAFVLYTAMFFLYEYVLLILGTAIPYFGKHVLGIDNTFQTTILLGVLFVVGMISLPLWRWLDVKIGSKKAYGIAIIAYLITSLPLLLLDNYNLVLIIAILMGFGFGGMLYFSYLLISDVIDEDELKTGVRREGTYFGVTNFFMRLSMIISILTISIVFTETEWQVYTPNPGIDVVWGIRSLVVIFPGLALLFSLICLYFYPMSKAHVEQLKKDLTILHEKKILQDTKMR